jgi:ABC-type transporter Mla subunit MlaD
MLTRRRTCGTGFAVLLAMLTSAAPSARQVTTGTIIGTVTDANGIVPGASVTIREVNRGTSDTVVTDATGSYTERASISRSKSAASKRPPPSSPRLRFSAPSPPRLAP